MGRRQQPFIPDEIWDTILRYSNAKTNVAVGATCRRLHFLCQQEHLWAIYFQKDQLGFFRELHLKKDTFKPLMQFDASSREAWTQASEYGIHSKGWKRTYIGYMEQIRKSKDEPVDDGGEKRMFLVSSAVMTGLALDGFMSFTVACIPACVGLLLVALAVTLPIGRYALPLFAVPLLWLMPALYEDHLLPSHFLAMIPWSAAVILIIIVTVVLILHNRTDSRTCFRALIGAFMLASLLLWFVFASLKRDLIVQWSWKLTLVPLYILLGSLPFFFATWTSKAWGGFVATCLWLIGPCVQLGLLVDRMDVNNVTPYVILLIPTWILIFVLFLVLLGGCIGLCIFHKVVYTSFRGRRKFLRRRNLAQIKSFLQGGQNGEESPAPAPDEALAANERTMLVGKKPCIYDPRDCPR